MTNRTAANRYARALLDVAVREKADLQAIEQQLAEFAELFTRYPALEQVMLNPAIPVQRKRTVVETLVGRARLVAVLGKLLVLLAGRDRLALLPDLLGAYRDRLLDYQKVVRAEVTTAVPLATDRAKAVQDTLAGVTGRTVLLQTRVDPSIIGGVVARIGSTVYDGSLTTQLLKIKERLVERT